MTDNGQCTMCASKRVYGSARSAVIDTIFKMEMNGDSQSGTSTVQAPFLSKMEVNNKSLQI